MAVAFYLLAYLFWIPVVISDIAVMLFVAFITLVPCIMLGVFGLVELYLKRDPVGRVTYWIRKASQLWGGIVLLYWLNVYIPETGRIVAHWPLDLLITVLGGIIMLYYFSVGVVIRRN